MARQTEFDRFLIIECTANEMMLAVGTCVVVCDLCGRPALPSDKGYYVAVLNRWMCPDCFGEWKGYAKWYAEDAHIERRHFDFYVPRLGVKCQ